MPGLKLGLHAGAFCPGGIGAYHAGPQIISKNMLRKKRRCILLLKSTFLVKIENKIFMYLLKKIPTFLNFLRHCAHDGVHVPRDLYYYYMHTQLPLKAQNKMAIFKGFFYYLLIGILL